MIQPSGAPPLVEAQLISDDDQGNIDSKHQAKSVSNSIEAHPLPAGNDIGICRGCGKQFVR